MLPRSDGDDRGEGELRDDVSAGVWGSYFDCDAIMLIASAELVYQGDRNLMRLWYYGQMDLCPPPIF